MLLRRVISRSDISFQIACVTPPLFSPSLPQTIYEDRHVLNLIQEPCDSCKEATYDRGRRR